MKEEKYHKYFLLGMVQGAICAIIGFLFGSLAVPLIIKIILLGGK